MNEHTARSGEADFDWCYDVVDDVSRTFALTIAELEEPIAREICVGYLLCRVADTIEDTNEIPPREQSQLLELYHDVLDPAEPDSLEAFMTRVEKWIPASPNADWQVVAETPRLVGTFHALPVQSRDEIRSTVQEMSDGMATFVDRYADEGGLRLETFDELEEYCWYVAGTVGYLVTGLVARDSSETRREALYETAESFGLLLQLVNVAKDVATDYDGENNVYVPTEVLRRHGLTHDDIGDETRSEAFEPVIREIVSRAEQYTEDAKDWLDTMPRSRGNVLSAWAIPFLLSIGTIRELKARPADVIRDGDVKIRREEVHALIGVFAREDEPSLDALQEEIGAEPLGQ